MRKILAIIGLSIVLTGCATHQQANQTTGAVLGGVVGNHIGGTPGAIFGAGMGAIIGGQQPTEQHYHRPPIHEYRQYRHNQCEIYRHREHSCYSYYRHYDVKMCLDDNRIRYYNCMSRY